MIRKNSGFTLVEIMVVITILALIMVSIIGVTLSVFRVQNQTKSNSKVTSGGDTILKELKKNILNSNSSTISCSADKSLVSFINNFDGQTTVISCSEGKIASTSAQTVYLNSGDVSIIDCSQFATCYTLPSLEISGVGFKFGIGTSVSGIGSSQNFEMTVTVRN